MKRTDTQLEEARPLTMLTKGFIFIRGGQGETGLSELFGPGKAVKIVNLIGEREFRSGKITMFKSTGENL